MKTFFYAYLTETHWPCFLSTASANSRKDKSLRVMSQKFIMLFLVSCPPVVSLEIAAKILIGEDHVVDQDKNKFKSECGSHCTY